MTKTLPVMGAAVRAGTGGVHCDGVCESLQNDEERAHIVRSPVYSKRTHFQRLGFLPPGVHTVLTLEIKADAHVRGYVGEKVKLKCTFKSTSSVTDKLTIDWTYRPPSSSRTESVSVW